jgi:CRISPR-associated endoribonuclease Cas6
VRLRAKQEQAYRPAYHVKLQGVLYDVLERSGYEFVHDESPFKFVTFSNIFPPRDMDEGDERTWIVASPHEELIESVSDTFSRMSDLEVGDQSYWVNYTSTFGITPEENGRMITGTPIVVRIPAGRCKEYGIDPEYDDVYWRLDHPIDAFVEEIERNLASKYEKYYDEQPPDRPYFVDLAPQNEVAVPLHYSDEEVQTIGTTWELGYECRTRPMYRLIEMAYSAGLGELNTTGFGFVNEVSGR